MYFLETNIFWPNPHPTRTHHTKFPVPSSGHSTTVPWRAIFYLFNFYFLKFSCSSYFSSQLVYILFFSGHCPLSLHSLSTCIVCLLSWKLFFFFNHEINFTWLEAINAPRNHREPPWLPPGPNVITIQSTIGHPRKEKICTLFQVRGHQMVERQLSSFTSKCPA